MKAIYSPGAVLRIIEAAAADGRPPPRNTEIAAELGCCKDRVVKLLANLRHSGVIELEQRPGASRRFTITSTGQQTAWSATSGAPHAQAAVIARADTDAKLLALARQAIEAGLPLPTNKQIAEQFGWYMNQVEKSLLRLTRSGALEVEALGGVRRVRVDGVWSPWSTRAAPLSAPRNAKQRRPKARAASTYDRGGSAAQLRHRVLDHLVGLAEVGAPVPSLDDLARAMGTTRSPIEAALRQLRGSAISVEREGGRKRAVILASGKATGWSAPTGGKAGGEIAMTNPAWAIPCAPRNGGEDWPQWLTCQWLEGEPSERSFCGQPTKEGSSYCEHHHPVCWSRAA